MVDPSKVPGRGRPGTMSNSVPVSSRRFQSESEDRFPAGRETHPSGDCPEYPASFDRSRSGPAAFALSLESLPARMPPRGLPPDGPAA